jgi:hypothetical protein
MEQRIGVTGAAGPAGRAGAAAGLRERATAGAR